MFPLFGQADRERFDVVLDCVCCLYLSNLKQRNCLPLDFFICNQPHMKAEICTTLGKQVNRVGANHFWTMS